MTTPHPPSSAARGVCGCWVEPSLHQGHCCFAAPVVFGAPLPCGHDAAGLAARSQARITCTTPPPTQSDALF